MPLFGHKEPAAPVHTTTTTSPQRKPTLFSRRRSSSPDIRTTHTTTPAKKHSLLPKFGTEDSSISIARERVASAEAAERDADRALFAARAAVREAREHIKRLEREAAEEARLAKIKQSQAKAIGKKSKGLGRHGI